MSERSLRRGGVVGGQGGARLADILEEDVKVASQPFIVGWRAKVHVSVSSIQRDCALTIKARAANDKKK